MSHAIARRLLAGACALTLVLAACGDDGDDDAAGDTTTTVEEATTTTEETTTTVADEPSTSTGDDPAAPDDEPGDEATGDDPDAVALAESINLTLDSFAEGWTEEPADEDDGEGMVNACFVDTPLDDVTLGRAETPTFSIESDDGSQFQIVAMQTIVFDSVASAEAALAEAQGDTFVACATDGIVGGIGGTGTLEVTVDDPSLTDESLGLAGDIEVTIDGTPSAALVDLHLLRTQDVVSFTAIVDVGDLGFEGTLTDVLTEVATRHAANVG